MELLEQLSGPPKALGLSRRKLDTTAHMQCGYVPPIGHELHGICTLPEGIECSGADRQHKPHKYGIGSIGPHDAAGP
eukprot:3205173-Amphidinium_carterae.1